MQPDEPASARCGRFAPSPTGPLHFGSLVAALGSFLDARAARGRWLVRIEDVDRPRCVPGAAEAILNTLGACGMTWDGEVLHQSRRRDAYVAALTRLRATNRLYPCACSRREIADSALAADGARRYPGTCRTGLQPGREARAWRLRVDAGRIEFDDRLLGPNGQDVEREVGDFVLYRADGLFAYQLAVVVDDAQQGVTDVVRGADLLDSTPRQILLQRCLDLPTPRYLHLPVAVNARGEKLSKQTRARPVEVLGHGAALVAALRFLGLAPHADVAAAPPERLLDWAVANWKLEVVPARRSLPVPDSLE